MSVLGAEVAQDIGEAYDGGNGDLDYVTHKIAHAALGGAMDLASGGDGVSGAIGGAVGEITGETLATEIEVSLLSGEITPDQAKAWHNAGVDIAKLSAGLAAFAAGESAVDTAANAGGNAADNNAFFALPVLISAVATGLEVLDKVSMANDVLEFYEAVEIGNVEKQNELLEGVVLGVAIETTVGSIAPGSYLGLKALIKKGKFGLVKKLLDKIDPDIVENLSEFKRDGVYDPHAVRQQLEDVYGPQSVVSGTVPRPNMKNVKLAGKKHDISGVPFDERGFPIFDQWTSYDTRLDFCKLDVADSYTGQMKAASKDLWGAIKRGEVPRSMFNEKQLKQIKNGSPKVDGYTWHHHQDSGRMQLVEINIHQKTGHIGGEGMKNGK